VKRRRLWAGLALVAVAVTVGLQLMARDPWAILTARSGSAAATATTNSKVDALLQAGIKQVQLNDLGGAAKTYRKVLEVDPDNKRAWYNLGVIAQRDGKKTEARTAYDKALKSDPNFSPALYNKAILLEPSDTDQAIGILQRIVAANPKASTAYLHLGQNLAKKDRDSEAKAAFGRAVRLDPSLGTYIPERFRAALSAGPSSQPRAD
jgi:Flp pilus assembly protein TadD